MESRYLVVEIDITALLLDYCTFMALRWDEIEDTTLCNELFMGYPY
jgi:hypothetical protein